MNNLYRYGVVIYLVFVSSLVSAESTDWMLKVLKEGDSQEKFDVYLSVAQLGGARDAAVLDQIQDNVFAAFNGKSRSKIVRDEIVLGSKALIASGQYKYYNFVDQVHRNARSKKIKNEIAPALDSYMEFVEFNLLQKSKKYRKETNSPTEAFIMRLVSHNNVSFKTYGVKKAVESGSYFNILNNWVVNMLQGYNELNVDEMQLALVKQGAEYLSRHPERGAFKAVLIEMREHAKSEDVRLVAGEKLESFGYMAELEKVKNSRGYLNQSFTKEQAYILRLIDHSSDQLAILALEKAVKGSLYFTEFEEKVVARLRSPYLANESRAENLEFQILACRYLGLHPESGKYSHLLNQISNITDNKELRKMAAKLAG